MLRLTLAQMRRSVGRLTAAGLAVLIGTGFVAATLLAGDVLTRTTTVAVAAGYAEADLVLVGDGLSYADLEAVRALPAVAAATGDTPTSVQFSAGGAGTWLEYHETAPDPRLDPLAVVDGSLPAAPGQVALPVEAAGRLGIRVGDPVTASVITWDGQAQDTTRVPLTLSGTLDDPRSAFAAQGGAAVVDPADAAAWAELAGETGPEQRWLASVTTVLTAGVDLEEARDQLGAAVPGSVVRTVDEQAQVRTDELSGGEGALTALVLGFAGVALLVAALVIANTFQVLVAQRTRTLALLRCVGATTRQLRRSVLLESVVLGLLASLAGVLAGTGLAQTALTVLRGRDLDVPLPAAVDVTPTVVLVPVVVGTLVTVLAALVPARAAGRVAPLAALRPEPLRSTARAGRSRLVVAVLLTAGGMAGLVLGLVVASVLDPVLGLGLGMLAGAVSFTGVLIGAVFWVPHVVAAAGRVAARVGGAATALAAANTVRNPRRTAATSSALLIGVTLVALFATGAANARTSLADELGERYPVDVALTSMEWGADGPLPLPPELVDEVAAVDGVSGADVLRSTRVLADTSPEGTGIVGSEVYGVDPVGALDLVNDPGLLSRLDDDTVLMPLWLVTDTGIQEGATVWLSPDTPAGAGEPVALRVVVGDLGDGVAVVTPTTLRALDPAAPATGLWLGLERADDAHSVVMTVQDLVSTGEASVAVHGAVVTRANFESVIDTLLAVVLGLLAVAVVIALIGVANTLSLSVLERRRESATLRAIGLTRRQLRATLAVEGLLIAGVGAVLGSVLGTVYGWVGARTVLAGTPFGLTVPWRDLALVLVVALAAGLLASVLPGRAAARTAPVAALAVD